MTNASIILGGHILNHFFCHVAIPAPDQLFIRLYISDPTEHNTGTEVQGAGTHPSPLLLAPRPWWMAVCK